MRNALVAGILALIAVDGVRAQNAVIIARAVVRADGRPLRFLEVSAPQYGIKRLTNESGTAMLRDLPPGEVTLRFRGIGFAPKDTIVTVAANETANVRVEMTRLAIALPTVVVEGACKDRTPFEEKTPILAELFDQVKQNAERLVLLAKERPFTLDASEEQGLRTPEGAAPPTRTFSKSPLPDKPYVPGRVFWRMAGTYGVRQPDLADIADTAFTNNHCLWYAGQTRFGADSVIRVHFEPVPWLAKGVDFEGSVYLRVDDYRLVGMITRLNRMPREFRNHVGYATSARFDELVPGIPILAEWEVTNTMRGAREPTVVATGRVTGVRWVPPE